MMMAWALSASHLLGLIQGQIILLYLVVWSRGTKKSDSRSWDVVRRCFIEQNWNIYYSGGLRRSLEALLSYWWDSWRKGLRLEGEAWHWESLVKLAGGSGVGGWVVICQSKSRSEVITGGGEKRKQLDIWGTWAKQTLEEHVGIRLALWNHMSHLVDETIWQWVERRPGLLWRCWLPQCAAGVR